MVAWAAGDIQYRVNVRIGVFFVNIADKFDLSAHIAIENHVVVHRPVIKIAMLSHV
jgi:hypothetical protein